MFKTQLRRKLQAAWNCSRILLLLPIEYLILIYCMLTHATSAISPYTKYYRILHCFVLCLRCYSCLALQYCSTQQYPLSHPSLSRPSLYCILQSIPLPWEHWHVWSTKQIPQQASHFPVESQGLGGMLTLHYSMPPHTQRPQWTTRLYLPLLGSRLRLFLSPSLFLRYSHCPHLSPPPPFLCTHVR